MKIFFTNIIKFGKTLSVLSKKFNRELIYNKKLPEAEEISTQKKAFIVFLNQ